jgi:signal transduction histidine kinase
VTRRGTLVARLATWIAASTAISLVVFALVAYLIFRYEEGDEDPEKDSPGEIGEDVLLALAIASPVGLGLAVGSTVWLTRRALAPVDRVIATAARIGANHLDERLPVPAAHDELRSLVIALNSALDRVETGYNALSAFAASVSHELRTPLAVMSSELEIALRRTRPVEEWEKSGRAVLTELHKMARLLDALLDLARADAIRSDQLGRLEIGAVVDEAIAAHAHLASSATVEVRASLPHDLHVHGHRESLVSAVGNLVRNAIQHSPAGAAVQVGLSPADDTQVAIIVEDAGAGLADAAGEEEAIFRPFYRGARPSSHGGLGLGLAIARRIVDRHGGDIRAARLPAGARFTILLPMV